MKYLLDTHYLIWSVMDTKKLSKKVRDAIVDHENQIIVSSVSFWEISLKYSLGKLEISGFSPEELPDICLKMGFETESLSAGVCSSYHQLNAVYHKDPFDRLLIWQAITHGYTLISADDNIKKYISAGLKLLV